MQSNCSTISVFCGGAWIRDSHMVIFHRSIYRHFGLISTRARQASLIIKETKISDANECHLTDGLGKLLIFCVGVTGWERPGCLRVKNFRMASPERKTSRWISSDVGTWWKNWCEGNEILVLKLNKKRSAKITVIVEKSRTYDPDTIGPSHFAGLFAETCEDDDWCRKKNVKTMMLYSGQHQVGPATIENLCVNAILSYPLVAQ
jgi:hypothetical protein